MVQAIHIPNELANRRRALGMPLDELSRRAGVSASTVKRFLTGNRWPSGDRALKISECLGMPGFDDQRARGIEHMRMRQAVKKARQIVRLTQGTMALEAQAVDEATKKNTERMMAYRLLHGPRVRLWTTI